MAETSSRDFVDWQEFRQIEMNTASREDYYLAAIATEVRRTVAKDPSNVKLEDFILQFNKTKASKDVPLTTEELEARMARSKAAWFALAGLTPP